MPDVGPLRWLAVCASFAIVFIVAAAVRELVAGRKAGAAWAVLPLVLAVISVWATRTSLDGHRIGALVTFSMMAYAAYRLRGAARWLEVAAAVCWGAALIFARLMFGR